VSRKAWILEQILDGESHTGATWLRRPHERWQTARYRERRHSRVSNGRFASAKQQLDKNAFLESFADHVRCLNEFFSFGENADYGLLPKKEVA